MSMHVYVCANNCTLVSSLLQVYVACSDVFLPCNMDGELMQYIFSTWMCCCIV